MPFPARPLLAALAALLAAAGSAAADTAGATLNVRVVVQASCSITGATLDFGTYSSGQSTDLRGSAQIAFSACPAGTLRFELDGGANASGTTRRLGDGKGNFLTYGLYRDSARTLSFGQASDAKLVTLTTPGAGRVWVLGAIPANQLVAAGTYTDTVAIVVTF
jgi:spore coat protein U-like protein